MVGDPRLLGARVGAPVGGLPGRADATLQQNIVDNGNHPSIAVWSIANELSSRPGPGQTAYIKGAVALAHQLDPTRPVGLALAGYPSVSCQSAYAPLQVIGINDYFGWYPGPGGQISDRTLLPAYLDAEEHCYHRQALMVTEFGAEADRDGPVQERGTYEFQNDFIQYHLGVFATKPYLSAALYWALEDFRVFPAWTGENPIPDPPIFHKGLLDFSGNPKPAYAIVKQLFGATSKWGRRGPAEERDCARDAARWARAAPRGLRRAVAFILDFEGATPAQYDAVSRTCTRRTPAPGGLYHGAGASATGWASSTCGSPTRSSGVRAHEDRSDHREMPDRR